MPESLWRQRARALDAEGIELSVSRIHGKIGCAAACSRISFCARRASRSTLAVVQRLRERHALAFQEQAASSRLLPSMSHRTSRYVPSGDIGFSDGMRIPKLVESAQTTTYQHVESA